MFTCTQNQSLATRVIEKESDSKSHRPSIQTDNHHPLLEQYATIQSITLYMTRAQASCPNHKAAQPQDQR